MESIKDRLMVVGGICIFELIFICVYQAVVDGIASVIDVYSWPGVIALIIPAIAYFFPAFLLVLCKPDFWLLGILINIFLGWTIIGYAVAFEFALQPSSKEKNARYEKYKEYLKLMRVFLKDYGEYDHYLLDHNIWLYLHKAHGSYVKSSAESSMATKTKNWALKSIPDHKGRDLFIRLVWLYENDSDVFNDVAKTAYRELGKEYENPADRSRYRYPTSTATIMDQYGNTYQVYKN